MLIATFLAVGAHADEIESLVWQPFESEMDWWGDDTNAYLADEEIRAVGVDDRVHKVQLVAFRAESENRPGDKSLSDLQGDVLIGTNGVTVITRDDRVRTITRA